MYYTFAKNNLIFCYAKRWYFFRKSLTLYDEAFCMENIISLRYTVTYGQIFKISKVLLIEAEWRIYASVI